MNSQTGLINIEQRFSNHCLEILTILSNGQNDQERREKLTDELNERMRVHIPRLNSIKLNVAEARKITNTEQTNSTRIVLYKTN